jgi:hypothetical protein
MSNGGGEHDGETVGEHPGRGCACGPAVGSAISNQRRACEKMPGARDQVPPTLPAGSKGGAEQAQRDYFRECIAKNGDMNSDARK